MSKESGVRRVGIVGYGYLGQYLVQKILKEGSLHHLELAFVWNRHLEKMEGTVPEHLQLRDLSEFDKRQADLIVEVAHSSITRDHGTDFLSSANFMVGSPTTLADHPTEKKLREASRQSGKTLYIPRGALWGVEDIQKMADRGTLKALKITMTKHPDSFKLEDPLVERNDAARTKRLVLYEGAVRGLCPLAPNNVNTMAAASMAAHTLGFDGVVGVLIADPSLSGWHLVDIEVTGPTDEQSGNTFNVKTSRRNPARPSSVTGIATFDSFWSSLLTCSGHGGCVYLC
ncbi:aspartate dehydrogenase domain-containing protein [Microcaecilia unicolor]|uniref:Aspartate dehydrogenase domain-containing protein n=1 Tax=Microcaecilia unicolor TaxID=1415580 RepID=A0A6P7XTU6_9AMPH|nr:putative L-aspartate dehydrogenase [Microcaecilia unicolor]XP_030053880.1 putative L-aspartate dehydrogenase [Microcaecilia unicolor]XP_030053881.1 putative L-aspartate dehydrogenase [Microcaecilia unicolor]XP_030053882.1 putative L-aspartate dehydrogenase [Microcaecilia unicolor]